MTATREHTDAAGRIRLVGPTLPDTARILTPDALAFVAELDARFAQRRAELLRQRRERAQRLAAGWNPDFNPDTAHVRADAAWRVAPPAPGLDDRRVEITGPPQRRMTAHALNSGAKVWLADFEDANAPTWRNLVEGQANLLDAVAGTLGAAADGGRRAASPDPATIVVRPRGWHLDEQHLLLDDRPASGAITDFALYLFHCGRRQIERGSGPYYYLPKLESHLEARLWNDVFVAAQDLLAIPRGSIRATVLIETIFAAFEMDEILYELREHAAGLNAGRWDYLFSIVKGFADRGPEFTLPDRAGITMTAPFMRAYTRLLVDTCHRRGAHAIGGMSAFIPSRDPDANAAALEQVRRDKQREADDGFDGSWVAHPGLVDTCRAVFDHTLGDEPNQIHRPRERVSVTAADLLDVASAAGTVTRAGVRANIAVAIRYLDAWLRGNGAVAVNGLMEDVATAEIARCQIWQWLRNHTPLADGGTVDADLVQALLDEETSKAIADWAAGPGPKAAHRLQHARTVFEAVALRPELPPYLTTWAYPRYLVEHPPDQRPAPLPAAERLLS